MAVGALMACASPVAPSESVRPLAGAEIAEIGRLGVVYLEVPALLGGSKSGSGAYLGDGYVLTAAHVVASGDRRAPVVHTYFGGRSVGTARILAFDPDGDLALLLVGELLTSGAQPLRWGDSTALAPGEPLVVVGYPRGVGLTVTRGIVSGVKRLGGREFIQTDAAVNPGNSGGPVLNERGQLVGIADWVLRGSAGLNFAVPSSVAFGFFEFMVRPRTLGEALADREAAVYAMNEKMASWDRRSPQILDEVAELALRSSSIVERSRSDSGLDWYRGELAALDYRYAVLQQRRAVVLSLGQIGGGSRYAADLAAVDREFASLTRDYGALAARYASYRATNAGKP